LIILVIDLLFSCSVYKSPAYIERKGVVKVLAKLSANDSTIRIMENIDSLDILFKAINFNENIDYETDTTFKIVLLREIKKDDIYDSTTIQFSVRGDEYCFYNVRKNPYGKVLSKGIEYFRLSRPLSEFIFGAYKTK
jgi:hypothetical protein